jgi:hypothetical protein
VSPLTSAVLLGHDAPLDVALTGALQLAMSHTEVEVCSMTALEERAQVRRRELDFVIREIHGPPPCLCRFGECTTMDSGPVEQGGKGRSDIDRPLAHRSTKAFPFAIRRYGSR